MKITNFSVKNYQFTLIIFLLVAVVGLLARHTIFLPSGLNTAELTGPVWPIGNINFGCWEKVDELMNRTIKQAEQNRNFNMYKFKKYMAFYL